MVSRKFRRSKETFRTKADIPLTESQLETVDFAVYNFINDTLNISCETNDGWKKVPVKWVGQERSAQARRHPEERGLTKALIYPLITVERNNKIKSERARGKYYGNIPFMRLVEGTGITLTRRINHEKTANFQNADSFRRINGEVGVGAINFPSKKPNSNKIVYEIIQIPQPVYIEMAYEITLVSEYQEQMNLMVAPFLVEAGSVNAIMLEYSGHKFEAFFEEDFTENNNVKDLKNETRKFETVVKMRVYGYLLDGDKNSESPRIMTHENAVEFKIQRERVIFGDINQHIANGKYRR